MLQIYVYRFFASRSLAFLGALSVLGGYCLSASALTPATLLTRDLERREVNLTGLGGGVVSYFGEDRTLTREPVEQFVRLTLEAEADAQPVSGEPSEPAAQGAVELVDGQRIAGRFAGPLPDGEGIVWEHPGVGGFELRLDDLRRVVFQADAAGADVAGTSAPPAAEGDVVQLTNGDTLGGFVVAIDEDGLTLVPDEGAEVTLPLERVATLTLSNPSAPTPAGVDLLVLTDGSRLRGGGVSLDGTTVRFTPTLRDAASPVTLPLDALSRIDFASSGLALIDLADRPMRLVGGGEVFGLNLLPRIVGPMIYLHAPMSVRFDVPAGAKRAAFAAELDLPSDLPPGRSAWADVLVRVEVPAGAGDEQRLTDQQSRADFGIELPPDAASINLMIEEGRYGPVLDRVRLREAVLLVETAEPDGDGR